MTDQPSTATDRMQARIDHQKRVLRKREVLAAIGGKWGKFSEQELSDLKNEDDLAVQVATKYGIVKDIAQRDVAALLNGRTL